jgi:antitoxin ParD1/3/4
MSMMKIVTCNLPEPFISAMEKLISEYGLYPSRSELIRVAVREFLIKELKVLDKFNEYSEQEGEIPETMQIPKRVQNIDMRTIRNFHNLHSVKK